MFFRHISISVPVDPLEWQISQDTANTIIATLANTLGAAESVLRVAATGHDKRLFVKIHFDVSGRISGAAVRSYLLERNLHCFYQLCASGKVYFMMIILSKRYLGS
ncbi:hypothetical protein MKW94_002226 [Papaver nudicaule]|uniref:Uncharacterized protein n=1 Tax=Papaver nudicaule TaxID=74823 RepID=A0AA41VUV4_PAPNU|nr:hypothetical protein [Papaver nudicaule]